MNLKKPAVSTTWCLAAKAVATKDFSSAGRWDGGRIGLAGEFDAGVAFGPLGIGLRDFHFPAAGLYG